MTAGRRPERSGAADLDAPELQAVVAKAYAAIAEPESFVALLGEMIDADEKLGGIGSLADMHFANAEAIFDKVYPLAEADYGSMLSHLENDLECDLALDPSFRVLMVNTRVFDGLERDAYAPEWLFDPVLRDSDMARLRRAAEGDERLFLRLFTDPDDDAGRWFSAYRVPIGGVHIIALQAVRLRWDERNADAFRAAFELTETETALFRHMVTGGSTREFAEMRGRSVGTARNQLKALQKKLQINSKEQLLLLYAGFISSLDPVTEKDPIEHVCANLYCNPDGLTIAWEEQGDPEGLPVLFFHALEGPLLTPKVEREAVEAGLRIIGPWRPFYGGTSGVKQGPGSPEEFAGRLAELLDHLEIERCTALGTQAGTPFLAAFAQAHPDRLNRTIAAGPFLPIVESEDYRFLQTRQRTHFRICRIAPGFARVYMRAMLASMGTGEFHRFVEDYYDNCPRELATVQRPDVVRNFRRAANYVLPRGRMGPGDTMLTWSAQWGHLLEGLSERMMILLGSEDANTPTEFARLSAERFGLAEPILIPDAGSFLIEDQPRAVFEAVRATFDA
ncbi:alpha/beta hydrolase [Erythrobacter sp.]|jgi:pimeloyl-ACP methyl ester carboxylesterase/DNA-binding CsgD family transcriptional regulator|uniref:alpha/beta hydrolase n=1 Tax=Erythrobacter sp. TaxID=1042 RepID=UPI002EA91436|nr:alpha/beta hydrolase [Erythrobacter sp.]